MMLAVKPISSPGRPDKFPPPLMRFLRTNVASRSRGRSRSSPMFVLRRKSAAIDTQEPSSPKVTCMGQVRVRRNKGSGTRSNRTARTANPNRRRCRWIRNSFSFSCCHCDKGGEYRKPKKAAAFSGVWRKCVTFFGVIFTGRKGRRRRRSNKTKKGSPDPESRFGDGSEDLEREEDDQERAREVVQQSNMICASISISAPPKNALLLTRSRSAPYRSSSLACRFWGSPLASDEPEQQKQKQNQNQEGDETNDQDDDREDDNPTSNTESVGENSGANSRSDPEMEIVNFNNFNFSEAGRERFSSDARIEGIKEKEEAATGGSDRPSILTRCKSEPARIAATRLVEPELSFWKKRRLGFT